jgi:hypothetical protein
VRSRCGPSLRELQPGTVREAARGCDGGGYGGGEGHRRWWGWLGRQVEAVAGGRNDPNRVGAPPNTRKRRGWTRDLGAPGIGARVGTQLECVFFSQPLLFELGLK